MKRINVYLDDDLWLSFRKKCLEDRRSASKALTELLREFLATTPPSVGSAQKELACKANAALTPP